ncbi:hypothetical protein [Streptacidiphilus griseoplanus]|uniref:hypothetical protein n=1 Tax=Peterkaempfera griseoplana TaxID=66896 RepID=UPI001FDFC29D|nr:hypothetical protein [Peterkaempfera griseoplana]
MPPSPIPADDRTGPEPGRVAECEVRGARQTKTLPESVRRWAERHIGRVTAVRDASHDWYHSRVWELDGGDGACWYVKVSPSVKFFTRETRATATSSPRSATAARPTWSTAARRTWLCFSPLCPASRRRG